MKDIFTSAFILAGAFFFLVSGLGVLRLPDSYSRMHAASKAGSLGLGLVLTGVILHFANWTVALKCILTILFIFLTAPVAAHILGRAAWLSGSRTWDRTSINELEGHYEREPSA